MALPLNETYETGNTGLAGINFPNISSALTGQGASRPTLTEQLKARGLTGKRTAGPTFEALRAQLSTQPPAFKGQPTLGAQPIPEFYPGFVPAGTVPIPGGASFVDPNLDTTGLRASKAYEGQYVTDTSQIGKVIKSQRGLTSEERAVLLQGRPSYLYEVDHIIPIWAGGADTIGNWEVLPIPEHDRKTKAQGVAYILWANKEIPTALARNYAMTWKDRDLSDIPDLAPGEFLPIETAKEIRKKWDQQASEVKGFTWKGFFEAIGPSGKRVGRQLDEATESLDPLIQGIVKGLATGITGGWINYTSDQNDRGGLETTGNVIGNIGGMLIPIGVFMKVVGMGTKGIKFISTAKQLRNSKLLGNIDRSVNKVRVYRGAVNEQKVAMAKVAVSNFVRFTPALVLYGQTTETFQETQHRFSRLFEDIAFGALTGFVSPTLKNSLYVGMAAATLSFAFSNVMEDSETDIQEALIIGFTMMALHGMSVPVLKKQIKRQVEVTRLAIIDQELTRSAYNTFNSYLGNERILFLGPKSAVPKPENLTLEQIILLRKDARTSLFQTAFGKGEKKVETSRNVSVRNKARTLGRIPNGMHPIKIAMQFLKKSGFNKSEISEIISSTPTKVVIGTQQVNAKNLMSAVKLFEDARLRSIKSTTRALVARKKKEVEITDESQYVDLDYLNSELQRIESLGEWLEIRLLSPQDRDIRIINNLYSLIQKLKNNKGMPPNPPMIKGAVSNMPENLLNTSMKQFNGRTPSGKYVTGTMRTTGLADNFNLNPGKMKFYLEEVAAGRASPTLIAFRRTDMEPYIREMSNNPAYTWTDSDSTQIMQVFGIVRNKTGAPFAVEVGYIPQTKSIMRFNEQPSIQSGQHTKYSLELNKDVFGKKLNEEGLDYVFLNFEDAGLRQGNPKHPWLEFTINDENWIASIAAHAKAKGSGTTGTAGTSRGKNLPALLDDVNKSLNAKKRQQGIKEMNAATRKPADELFEDPSVSIFENDPAGASATHSLIRNGREALEQDTPEALSKKMRDFFGLELDEQAANEIFSKRRTIIVKDMINFIQENASFENYEMINNMIIPFIRSPVFTKWKYGQSFLHLRVVGDIRPLTPGGSLALSIKTTPTTLVKTTTSPVAKTTKAISQKTDVVPVDTAVVPVQAQAVKTSPLAENLVKKAGLFVLPTPKANTTSVSTTPTRAVSVRPETTLSVVHKILPEKPSPRKRSSEDVLETEARQEFKLDTRIIDDAAVTPAELAIREYESILSVEARKSLQASATKLPNLTKRVESIKEELRNPLSKEREIDLKKELFTLNQTIKRDSQSAWSVINKIAKKIHKNFFNIEESSAQRKTIEALPPLPIKPQAEITFTLPGSRPGELGKFVDRWKNTNPEKNPGAFFLSKSFDQVLTDMLGTGYRKIAKLTSVIDDYFKDVFSRETNLAGREIVQTRDVLNARATGQFNKEKAAFAARAKEVTPTTKLKGNIDALKKGSVGSKEERDAAQKAFFGIGKETQKRPGGELSQADKAALGLEAGTEGSTFGLRSSKDIQDEGLFRDLTVGEDLWGAVFSDVPAGGEQSVRAVLRGFLGYGRNGTDGLQQYIIGRIPTAKKSISLSKLIDEAKAVDIEVADVKIELPALIKLFKSITSAIKNPSERARWQTDKILQESLADVKAKIQKFSNILDAVSGK